MSASTAYLIFGAAILIGIVIGSAATCVFFWLGVRRGYNEQRSADGKTSG